MDQPSYSKDTFSPTQCGGTAFIVFKCAHTRTSINNTYSLEFLDVAQTMRSLLDRWWENTLKRMYIFLTHVECHVVEMIYVYAMGRYYGFPSVVCLLLLHALV